MGAPGNTEPKQKSGPLIALVSSPYSSEDYLNREDVAFDDLELGYLHAKLQKEGFRVTYHHPMAVKTMFGSPYQIIMREILAEKADYIILADSIFTFQTSLDFSRELKDRNSSLNIIYCGPHASLYFRDILSNETHVEYVICGDCETPIPSLIQRLENHQDPGEIPGLAYRDGNKVAYTPPEFPANLDFLPLPHRPSLHPPDPEKRQLFNLVSSRGCPGHCTFCTTNAYLNRFCSAASQRWRGRSAEHVFDELQYLYENGVRRFFFMDDNWIGNRDSGLKRAVGICQLIIDRGLDDISLAAMIRPDSLRANDDCLSIMKQAGFRVLSMGLEAAHPGQLKRYGKKVDPGQVRELVSALFEMGIVVRCGFIMFFPYSSFGMLRCNAQFLDRIGLSYMLTAYSSVLQPNSAMPIERVLLRDNLVSQPTTYLSPGTYRFVDERVEALHRFMLWLQYTERDTLNSILMAGFEASRIFEKNRRFFDLLRQSLARIGEVNTDIFVYSLSAYETCPDTIEAFGKCHLYSGKWKDIIATEKAFLTRLIEETQIIR